MNTSPYIVTALLVSALISDVGGAQAEGPEALSAAAAVEIAVDDACQWRWDGAAGEAAGEGLYLTPTVGLCDGAPCERLIIPVDDQPPALQAARPVVEIAPGAPVDVIEACEIDLRDNCSPSAEIGLRITAVRASDPDERVERRGDQLRSDHLEAGDHTLLARPGAARTYTVTLAATDPALNRSEIQCDLVITSP